MIALISSGVDVDAHLQPPALRSLVALLPFGNAAHHVLGDEAGFLGVRHNGTQA
jgi:hypothetical protein